MTVQEIMDETGLKRGTIEYFRSLLVGYGVIGNNAQLDKRELDVLKRTIDHKGGTGWTWSDSMQREIQLEYAEEVRLPFEWVGETILSHLTWLVKNNRVEVSTASDSAKSEDFHIIYELMIDNFSRLEKKYPGYARSGGADGNPVLTFKLMGADFNYYLVGKLNHLTDHEDIHVFYCDAVSFNLMKTRHLLGCSSKKDIMNELWLLCNDVTRAKKKSSDPDPEES